MGLLSTYVAYKLGKRSQRRSEARESCEPNYAHPMSQHCVNYDYCTARGECPEFVECEYE